jgi:transcriptional regulator with XRE-family HTH domain
VRVLAGKLRKTGVTRMTAAQELDPAESPLHFFGAEVRRARVAAGMTLADLGILVPCDASTVSRIEAGILSPTERFGHACDEAFPQMAGLFSRFYQDSRRWNGPYPRWFEDWLIVEREAVSLRIWQPIIIHGLLQTADYARALFLGAQSDLSDDVLEQMVAARTSRQVILDTPEPPNLLVVLDEAVLHRLVGSSKIMHEQLVHLAAVSSRSHISVQVIPAAVGAHAGLGGAFNIAAVDGRPDAMHVDSVEGITVEKSAVVRKAGIAFDLVRGDALPRWASRDLILKVAEERWNA